jgi:hypothetical protein
MSDETFANGHCLCGAVSYSRTRSDPSGKKRMATSPARLTISIAAGTHSGRPNAAACTISG